MAAPKLRALAWVTVLATLVLIMLGAYVRLSHAGLGCPDWPVCYGQVTWPDAPDEIARANAQFERPVEVPKAWKEQVHRHLASIVGLLILALALLLTKGSRLRYLVLASAALAGVGTALYIAKFTTVAAILSVPAVGLPMLAALWVRPSENRNSNAGPQLRKTAIPAQAEISSAENFGVSGRDPRLREDDEGTVINPDLSDPAIPLRTGIPSAKDDKGTIINHPLSDPVIPAQAGISSAENYGVSARDPRLREDDEGVDQPQAGISNSSRLAVFSLGLVIFQAMLGMWTVTWLLLPLVVTAHLLGGMATLGLLVWLALSLSPKKPPLPVKRAAVAVGLVLLLGQIFLGGWTSTNYAALACPDFPQCNKNLESPWWPAMDFKEGFTLVREIGVDYEGGVLDGPARMAVHKTHRLGAIVIAGYLLWLGLTLIRRGATGIGAGLLTLLAAQVALGIANIVWQLPLPVAVLHNGVAALLLAKLVILLVRPAKP